MQGLDFNNKLSSMAGDNIKLLETKRKKIENINWPTDDLDIVTIRHGLKNNCDSHVH